LKRLIDKDRRQQEDDDGQSQKGEESERQKEQKGRNGEKEIREEINQEGGEENRQKGREKAGEESGKKGRAEEGGEESRSEAPCSKARSGPRARSVSAELDVANRPVTAAVIRTFGRQSFVRLRWSRGYELGRNGCGPRGPATLSRSWKAAASAAAFFVRPAIVTPNRNGRSGPLSVSASLGPQNVAEMLLRPLEPGLRHGIPPKNCCRKATHADNILRKGENA
jgi:hypothetical protein